MKAMINTSWHPLAAGQAPDWASAWGHDALGVWLEFTVGRACQKMRWIPPGPFVMGSPATEKGRWDDEGPQHRVLITRGFWLFDTPCTQSLWEAVMGSNPSRFVTPARPVEMVSWEDCQLFLARINAIITGLELALPTEAQWEYACRAGTTTATYGGGMEIQGLNNAPVLDSIAWYGGNSGVDFELKNGVDSSAWSEKQYPHERAGTRLVASKRPNAWGLYDMLGNVYEWCQDWYGAHFEAVHEDPSVPDGGAQRVARGGCWLSQARDVRSSRRNAADTGYRDNVIGFRCARVQD